MEMHPIILDNRLTVNGSIRIDQSNLFGTDPKYRINLYGL